MVKRAEKKLIRFDWAIKNILRDKSNFGILEGFLSELLKQAIKIIELLESESNKEVKNDKSNRVDLLVKLENGELVIIEVQNDDEYDYLHRILYGVSKVISENMKMGTAYKSVKKVISISIVYFDLGHGTDYVYYGQTSFTGIHNNDKLELSDDQKRLFKKEDLYQIFPEYYILKVNKFDEVTKDGLDEWVYFLKTDEIMDNFKAKGLKEAKEQLDILKMSKKDRDIYESYLEDLHLKASLADTQQFKLKKAKEDLERVQKESLEKGEQIGVQKGELEKAKFYIKKLLNKKFKDLPKEIEGKIDSCIDISILDYIADNIFDIDTIEQIIGLFN